MITAFPSLLPSSPLNAFILSSLTQSDIVPLTFLGNRFTNQSINHGLVEPPISHISFRGGFSPISPFHLKLSRTCKNIIE